MQTQTLTQADMIEAAQQLAKSDKGRNALTALLDWLNADGLGLDAFNKRAVFTLLNGAFGPFPGGAREAMEDALDAHRVSQTRGARLKQLKHF